MLPSLAAWWRAVRSRSQGTRARADRPRDIEGELRWGTSWGMRKSGVELSNPTTKSVAEIGAEHQHKVKDINNMHLQNVLMQLRKVCSHPILFEGHMHQHVMDEDEDRRSVISDAELDMLLDRRKEVFEGRGVGRKSGAVARAAKGRTDKVADSG
ncbi:hypothetical protein EDB83DRAFT_2676511 [Lactarius deliciosus]|nr:hypothetical protein EDB83DRAFT_2676511 [Lactarius deliciosus]